MLSLTDLCVVFKGLTLPSFGIQVIDIRHNEWRGEGTAFTDVPQKVVVP